MCPDKVNIYLQLYRVMCALTKYRYFVFTVIDDPFCPDKVNQSSLVFVLSMGCVSPNPL